MDALWGVVVGGAISVVSAFVLHRTTLSRERESRREVRQEVAHDRQREALIALQEGLEELQALSTEQGLRALEGTVNLEFPFTVYKLRSRIELLISRVTDDAAGKAARTAANRAAGMMGITDRDRLADTADKVGEAMRDFHERVGVLLRHLEEA